MDILAWVIIICFGSFIGLPALASWISGYHFISYKDAWIAGNGIALFLIAFSAMIFGIAWAFERVIW